MAISLHRLARASLTAQQVSRPYHLKSIAEKASISCKLGRFSLAPSLMPTRGLLQAKQVRQEADNSSMYGIYERTLKKRDLLLKDFRNAMEWEKNAKMKAFAIKEMFKGITLEQRKRFFSAKVFENQDLSPFLYDSQLRAELIQVAVTEHPPLLGVIYNAVLQTESETLQHRTAFQIVRALVKKNTAAFSQEIINWAMLGASLKSCERFAKDILQWMNDPETEIEICEGKAIPNFPKESWQRRFLSVYGSLTDANQGYPKIAWTLYLNLPLEESYDTDLHLITEKKWNEFFCSFDSPRRRKQAVLDIERRLLSTSRPLPALKAAVENAKKTDLDGGWEDDSDYEITIIAAKDASHEPPSRAHPYKRRCDL